MTKIKSTRFAAIVAAAALAFTATACNEGDETAAPEPTDIGGTVTLLTHHSWAVSDELLAAFEAETGITVEHIALGNTAELTNQLVLTAGNPLGDVVFGIDNTFASRALDAGIFSAHLPADLPASAQDYVLEDGALIPVTRGDVCLNYDLNWFAESDIAAPQHLADLARPELAELTVVLNPATSSPGLAFLLATISAFGDDGFDGSGWEGFWTGLRDGGVRVAESWSAAYRTEFSGSGEGGTRPIIVSYSSSPAFTLNDDGTATTTAALLDGCFRQVEYAGILEGTDNLAGARALVDWLVSPEFQADIPGSMWVYPVDYQVEMPENWAHFAPLAPTTFNVPAADIEAHRETWIDRWTAIVLD